MPVSMAARGIPSNYLGAGDTALFLNARQKPAAPSEPLPESTRQRALEVHLCQIGPRTTVDKCLV